jgi:hypothetical protein
MDVTIATEVAYKNGYEAGKEAAAEQIFEELDKLKAEGGVIWTNYAEAVLIKLKKKYNK